MIASSTSWVMKKQVFFSRSHVFQQLGLELGTGLSVQRAERLVHQQDFRIGGIGAGDCDALLHAAGKLLGIVVGELDQIDHRQIACRASSSASLPLMPRISSAKHDVLLDRQPREQGVLLGRRRRARCRFRVDFLAVAVNLAAGRLGQTGDDVEQSGFAAAGRADDGR